MREKEFLEPKHVRWLSRIGAVLSELSACDGTDSHTSCILKIRHQIPSKKEWKFLGIDEVNTSIIILCCVSLSYLWPGYQQWWKTWLQRAKAEETENGRCHVGDSRDPPAKFSYWSWLRACPFSVSSACKAYHSDIPHFLQGFTQVSSSKAEQLVFKDLKLKSFKS